MLVGLPVTFYITTLIGDVAYVSTSTLFWYQLAWFSNLLALGFGALAALAGVAEYFTIPRRTEAKHTANTHAILILGIFTLFLAGFLIRSADTFGLPDMAPPMSRLYALTGLSLIGVAALAVAGWLGWDLVYKHRIGIAGAGKTAQPKMQKGPVFNESDYERPRGRDEQRPPTNPGDAH